MRYLSPGNEPDLRARYGTDRLDQVLSEVISYMESAPIVIQGRSTFKHPALEEPQPMGQASDGKWVWPLVLPNLIRARVMVPEDSFLDHVEAVGYPPEKLVGDVLHEAIEVAKRGR
jgi:hypothetical protein